MPTIVIEDLENNSQVTIIISELVDIDDPNPPAEQPEDQERENVWLVSKQAEN